MPTDAEDSLLRDVALRNSSSILAARRRAEEELDRAKEELRATAERLRAVVSQAAAGIAVAGLDGRFEEVNQKFADILGYARDELPGLHFADITHPEDVATSRANAEGLLAGTFPDYAQEKRYVRKDGQPVWTLTTVTTLRDAEGKPRQFIAVVQDVTERKRVEEALRDETRVLELVNRTGTALASRLDLEAVVQAVTDAATELSGAQFGAFFYNTTDDNGESFLLYTLSGAPREAFEKLGQPRARELFGPTFRGEGPIRSDDVTLDPRYGQWAPHHGMPKGHLPVRSYLAVPVRSRSGEVIGGLFFGHSTAGVFTERSERLVQGIAAQAAVAIDNARLYEERGKLVESERAARSQAERASQLKDDFLATLSHELRTPLNAILGWSQILRRTGAMESDMHKGLETIERNARLQTQLIEDLLDISRITSGKVRLDIQPVEPVGVIEAAMESARPAADAKGIRFEKALDPSAHPISGDPGRLQQIIWNLLSNAIKFTPRGGKVQVVLERVNSHLEISVVDTGIGIEAQYLPHIFDRFQQADASTTRRYGGLGLGLSIVKHLVELHGGTVRVHSAGVDQGSTFTVQLPIAVVRRDGAAGARHPTSPPAVAVDLALADLAGLRVLVVDDEEDARDLVRRVLTDCRAEVSTAGSAEEALSLIESLRPHVLVSDIGMPDVDGYELLRRVRALGAAKGGRVPAVALTAFARSEDRTRALRAGFLVHVAKPVEPSELAASVASVAGRVPGGA